MSVEEYSNEVIVVAVADGPPEFRIWLREEAPAGLSGDLRWLCKEAMDSHIVLDLAHLGHLDTASCGPVLDLQKRGEDSDYCFVLCGLCPHVDWQLRCVRLSRQFDTFDTRQAAIMELAPQDAY